LSAILTTNNGLQENSYIYEEKNGEEEKESKEYSFSLAHEKEKKKRGIKGDTGALYTLRKQLTLFSGMHWGKAK